MEGAAHKVGIPMIRCTSGLQHIPAHLPSQITHLVNWKDISGSGQYFHPSHLLPQPFLCVIVAETAIKS